MSTSNTCPDGSPSEAAVATPVGHAVHDEMSGMSFLVGDGEVVLDAALAQGVELDHGCRNGVCGACALEIVEGVENVSPPDPIESNSAFRFRLGPNVRLACRMTCTGPLKVRPG